MIVPSPSILAEAERLFPYVVTPEMMIVDVDKLMIIISAYADKNRPAVAVSLQAERDRADQLLGRLNSMHETLNKTQDEIERLRQLFDDAMSHVPHPEDAHVNDRSEIEKLRQARTALSSLSKSTEMQE